MSRPAPRSIAAGVPVGLAPSANQRVLDYLKGKSAHSDLTDGLVAAVAPLGEVQLFCPDAAGYRFVAAATSGIIFGYAVGMDTVAFRLDERMRRRALETGGVACPEAGPEWVAVRRHREDVDWPAVDLGFWAQKAYAYARERGS